MCVHIRTQKQEKSYNWSYLVAYFSDSSILLFILLLTFIGLVKQFSGTECQKNNTRQTVYRLKNRIIMTFSLPGFS